MRAAVAVMAKEPVSGKSKTRLIPELGASGAANLYEGFLMDTVQRLHRRSDLDTYLAITPDSSNAWFNRTFSGIPTLRQSGATLGDRLASVLLQLRQQRYGLAFAVGSDSPDFPSADIDAAMSELARPGVDAVISPSDDGGYWLIGWKRDLPELVTGVAMSQPNVLVDTLAVARNNDVELSVIGGWYDVDDGEDLVRLEEGLDPSLTPETARRLAVLAEQGERP